MMALILLLIIVAIVLYVLYAQGKLGTEGKDPLGLFGKKETPREILDRRFAAGEIGEEEYKRMKKTLDE
jgi:uncharacterized membrane protein